ncbi:DUF6266 family protein [Algoriphagus sp.]|uniref:DUF6266 family protein n=1 Tax=Algoriphagus sp. TaxID=1872435 RepID=UPI002717B0B2|nr:DUF6266 family protein [Algoriphagus sp.]MDO8965052.1 DUF6266 family protein [Algoriphagus sp.]MDP3201861.1 DUF6266 family protein [Algoriphagus sp.]
MATLPNSNIILPKGKIGNLVFYTLNGKTVVRSKPSPSHKNKHNPSPLQLIQREKLQTINTFLKPIKQALDFGYQEFLTQSKKGMHWAYSEINTKGYNHTKSPKIDPAFLRISKGNLLGPENAQATRNGNSILITWLDNSTEGKAQPSDETFILCYCSEEAKYIWTEIRFRRNSAQAIIELDSVKSPLSWHVYLAFSQLNIKKKEYILSDSVYLGKV